MTTAKPGDTSVARESPIVLIVEDDPETRRFYQTVFERDGFRTDQAHNGLQAFEKAGADVLYAPGLRDIPTIRTVVRAVGKPLNVVMSAADPAITQAQLADAGVKRISVGGALSRLALAAFLKGAREMKDAGGFTWVRDTVPTKDLKAVFRATP